MTAPVPAAQPPGVHHRRVGDLVVTALNDGHVQLPASLYLGCDEAEGAALSRAAFGPDKPVSAINALLVRAPGCTTLIDTGLGGDVAFMHGGGLPAALRAAGVAPGDVDTVLLTHMHVDHTGGLLDSDGAPAFPRAELAFPAAEAAFWLDPAAMEAAPEMARPTFVLARQVADAYAGRTRTLEDGGLPAGITPLPLPGHSPGHTGYTVGTGADRLLVWADVVHVPALQIARPEIGMAFDSDPAQALATRQATLDMAATERLLVFGMHMDFPGLAFIDRTARGYAPVWSTWAPIL